LELALCKQLLPIRMGGTGTGVISPIAGVISPLVPYETVTTSRQIQFALKLVF
jgi:hypothetical protein